MLVLALTSLSMLSTLAGGMLAIRARRSLAVLFALGGGILLGTVFLDLLPEALTLADQNGWARRVPLAIALGGLLAPYLIGQLLTREASGHTHGGNHDDHLVGKMGAAGLIIHSLLDGAAIGAASLVGRETALLVTIAVVAHDAGDGLNTILLVTRGNPPRRGDLLILLLDAVAPVVGGLLAVATIPSARVLVVFLALAAGFFVHVATVDLLPEAQRHSPHTPVAVIATLGAALFGLVLQILTR
jgi:zinc transporter ZupT